MTEHGGGPGKPPRMPDGDDPRGGDPMTSMLGRGPRIRPVCRRKGHRWRQKVWGMLGMQVCARWWCEAQRTDPEALP
jgi:hypothetical protein